MKPKMLSIAVIALSLTVTLSAQKADFSGTWMLDVSKSEFPQQSGAMAGRGAANMREMTVVITQTADALQIDQKVEGGGRTLVYKLDGTESTNPGMRGTEVKSVSKWQGNAIVTEGTQTMSGPNGEITVKSREARSLAADGTMVVETTRETPRGKMHSKLVFRRAD